MTQLRQLATPFPPSLVRRPPKGKFGDYVPHSSVTERLLSIVGPFDTRVVQVITESDGMVTGVVLELTCHIDGATVTVQEAGDVENPGQKPTNGARLKDAISDAVKRCAMRLGCGLHLWSQDDYYLDKQLDKTGGAESPSKTPEAKPKHTTPEPAPEPVTVDDIDNVVELARTVDGDTESLNVAAAEALLKLDPTEGNMEQVQERIRRLCRHMEAAGLWPKGNYEDALHAALARRGASHLGDLKRVELDSFVRDAWEQAFVTIEANKGEIP